MKKTVNKNKIVTSIITLIFVCIVSGCSVRQPKIAYTVYPVRFLIERIAGDKVQLEGISDETLILRAQVKEGFETVIDEYDVLMYMGALEPYIRPHNDVINSGNITMLDLTSQCNIYKFGRYVSTYIDGEEKGDYEKYYGNPVFDSIDKYTNDPYLWMDPITMTSMASQVRDWLVSTYPEEADTFNANYLALETDLARLDAEYQKLKTRSSKIKIVTMTPSFGIWQQNYGIQVYPVVLSRYGVLPNSQQLQFIKQRIIDDNVKYIVSEPGLPEDIVREMNALADELGLEIIYLNSLSTLTEQQILEGKDYLQIMYENLAVLEGLE